MSTEEPTTRERVDDGERLLSLSQAGAILNMKRPNVARFLARRGIEPAMPKASGYFWWESDIQRVKVERESDKGRMAADEKRRAAALARMEANGSAPAADLDVKNLGRSQRAALTEMLRHPIRNPTDTQRLALKRLRERGFVEPVDDAGETIHVLTEDGRRAAANVKA